MEGNPLGSLFGRFAGGAAAAAGGRAAAASASDRVGAAAAEAGDSLRRWWEQQQQRQRGGGSGGDGWGAEGGYGPRWWEGGPRGGSSGSDGNGGEDHLSKEQRDELDSLLRRYALGGEGAAAASVPGSAGGGDEEAGGEGGGGSLSRSPSRVADEVDVAEICCGCCASLTYGERLLGCCVLYLGGFVLDIGTLTRFAWLLEGDPLPFVATWTLGHAVSLCGTMFLVGPKRQCQNMFQPVRAKATAAYLSCLVVTLAIVLACVIADRPTGLYLSLGLVTLLFVQCVCILWYTVSCIPFLRDYVSKRLCGDDGKAGGKSAGDDGKGGNKSAGNEKGKSDGRSAGNILSFFGRKRRDYEEISSR